jgi:hypothetical protein
VSLSVPSQELAPRGARGDETIRPKHCDFPKKAALNRERASLSVRPARCATVMLIAAARNPVLSNSPKSGSSPATL